MATSKAVARSLKKTATQLAKIPDDAIQAVSTEVVDEAISVGGTFTYRRRPLTAEAKVSGGKANRKVVIFGRYAGAWSIKTYGRQSGFTVKRRQEGSKRLKGWLVSGDRYATSTGPSRPSRNNWDDVVDFANDRAPELVIERLDEVID